MPWRASGRRALRIALVVGVVVATLFTVGGATIDASREASSPSWILVLGGLAVLAILGGLVFLVAGVTISNARHKQRESAAETHTESSTNAPDRDRVSAILYDNDGHLAEAEIADALDWSSTRTRRAVMELVVSGDAARYQRGGETRVIFVGAGRGNGGDDALPRWSSDEILVLHPDGKRTHQRDRDGDGNGNGNEDEDENGRGR